MSDEESVMSTQERLVYMANQIARNLASEGHDRAVDMTAEHIRSFWAPKMRQDIAALAEARPDALSPIAAAAVARIGAG